MYVISFQVTVKNQNGMETKSQGSNYFHHIGNGISWLNEKFNESYQNFYNCKDVFFTWAISNSENTYAGIFEVSNENFIQRVLDVNLEKFKK